MNSLKKIECHIKPFVKHNYDKSREELIEEFGEMLSENYLNSNEVKFYKIYSILKKIIKIITGKLMVFSALYVILQPIPRYLEGFTIYYFSSQDGITLSDIIALIILYTGLQIIIKNILKK